MSTKVMSIAKVSAKLGKFISSDNVYEKHFSHCFGLQPLTLWYARISVCVDIIEMTVLVFSY